MPKPLTVELSSRQVIEHKLLVALEEDSGQVAIVCNKQDLDLLIRCLNVTSQYYGQAEPKAPEMVRDLKRLRKEAFGA